MEATKKGIWVAVQKKMTNQRDREDSCVLILQNHQG